MVNTEKVKKVATLIAELKKLGVTAEISSDAEDQTVGTVAGPEESKTDEISEALIVERSATGRGFEMGMDYDKLGPNSKYKRLSRD